MKCERTVILPCLIALLVLPALAEQTDANQDTQAQAQIAASVSHGKGTILWIGRFEKEERAQAAAKKVEDMGLPVTVLPNRSPRGEFFVVLSGPFDEKKVGAVEQQLGAQGFTNVRPMNPPSVNGKINPTDGNQKAQAQESSAQVNRAIPSGGSLSASPLVPNHNGSHSAAVASPSNEKNQEVSATSLVSSAHNEPRYFETHPSTNQTVDRNYIVSFDHDLGVAAMLLGTYKLFYVKVGIQNKTNQPIPFQLENVSVTDAVGRNIEVVTKAEAPGVLDSDGQAPDGLNSLVSNYWIKRSIAPESAEEHGAFLRCEGPCSMPFTVHVLVGPDRYNLVFGNKHDLEVDGGVHAGTKKASASAQQEGNITDAELSRFGGLLIKKYRPELSVIRGTRFRVAPSYHEDGPDGPSSFTIFQELLDRIPRRDFVNELSLYTLVGGLDGSSTVQALAKSRSLVGKYYVLQADVFKIQYNRDYPQEGLNEFSAFASVDVGNGQPGFGANVLCISAEKVPPYTKAAILGKIIDFRLAKSVVGKTLIVPVVRVIAVASETSFSDKPSEIILN